MVPVASDSVRDPASSDEKWMPSGALVSATSSGVLANLKLGKCTSPKFDPLQLVMGQSVALGSFTAQGHVRVKRGRVFPCIFAVKSWVKIIKTFKLGAMHIKEIKAVMSGTCMDGAIRLSKFPESRGRSYRFLYLLDACHLIKINKMWVGVSCMEYFLPTMPNKLVLVSMQGDKYARTV